MKMPAGAPGIIACALALLLSSCAPSGMLTQGDGPAPDPLMGDWVGHTVSPQGVVTPAAVRVIALGGTSYRFTFSPAFDLKADEQWVAVEGKFVGTTVVFTGAPGWRAALENGEIIGASPIEGGIRFALRRVVRLSPNLGAEMPEGGVVLFDGRNLDRWQQRDPNKRVTPVPWKILEGGIMEVMPGSGDIITKQRFGDSRLHLEFRTPFMPEALGQARGNSGVYLQGRYEVQVLDSYGLTGEDNECGGIYKVGAPRVNMCAPPGQWQTYDLLFRAPRFDAEGKKTADARVTVVHNGVTIHENLPIPGPTGGAVDEDVRRPGGLLLQDHGNLVQYRNIWLVELKP